MMTSSFFIFQLLLSLCYAQLTAESASEGPCREDIDNYLAENANLTWFYTPRKYYAPMASEAGYRLYAEALLGRPVNSEKEIDDMKLRIQTLKGYKFRPSGFDPERRIYVSCPPTNNKGSQAICTPIITKCNSPGSNPGKLNHLAPNEIYTDNENDALFVHCANENFQFYIVVSVNPKIHPRNERIIRQKIKELGFSSKYMRYQTY